jgi:hypothetical protein
MTTEVEVLTPEQLDFAALVALEHAAFAEIIARTGTGDQFTEPYYRWKYNPPEGGARIALLHENGELLAANSMYPLRVCAGDGAVRAWQSCDTATHPKGRGRGYFLRCLAALREHLAPGEIFFGFPNKNSTPGFIKFGWVHGADVRTLVRIWPGWHLQRAKRVEPIKVFGPEQDAFAAALGGRGGPLLDRRAAYMNWRYFQHPLNRYECFAWRESGRQLGLLVMRRVELFGRVIAVAMELLALESRVEGALLAAAAAWARGQGIAYAMVLNNTTLPARALLGGYAPVPMWMLPKRQVLMGAANGAEAERIWRLDWRVQIGDWDGF